MKRLLIILLIQIGTFAAIAQTKQTITGSTLTYQVKNMGFNTTGSIGGLQGIIIFDKEHLSTSSIQATIDTKTINSENDMRDEHLRGAEFFDVAKYPTIGIKSVSFKAKSGNKFTGVFDLTIKSTTKRIEIPFTYTDNGSTGAFAATFKINRMDYGVGGSTLTLSNETTLNISIQTSK